MTKIASRGGVLPQLCAALPCVALQHPVRILPRKTVLILKINQLFSTKAQRVPKKCKIGKLGYVVSALPWQFDTIKNDLSGYGTKTMAYRFRIVFKSFHFFYRLRNIFKSLRIRIVFVKTGGLSGKISFRIGTISYLSFSHRLRVNGALIIRSQGKGCFRNLWHSLVFWCHCPSGAVAWIWCLGYTICHYGAFLSSLILDLGFHFLVNATEDREDQLCGTIFVRVNCKDPWSVFVLGREFDGTDIFNFFTLLDSRVELVVSFQRFHAKIASGTLQNRYVGEFCKVPEDIDSHLGV